MTILILDTNVVSELMKPSPNQAVEDWFMSHAGVMLFTTVITIAEISFGLARLPSGARRTKLTSAFDAFAGVNCRLRVLILDEHSARLAGQFRAAQLDAGGNFAMADMLIAGIAVRHKAILATRNTKDFLSLPVDLINPWAD